LAQAGTDTETTRSSLLMLAFLSLFAWFLTSTAPLGQGLKLSQKVSPVEDSPFEGRFNDPRLSTGNYNDVNMALKDVAGNDTDETHGPDEFLQKCITEAWGKCDFLGGAPDIFVDIGKATLARLRSMGMHPESRVLEVGMGLGRCAYPIIQFLNPGGYSGIEPNANMLAFGVAHLLGKQMLDEKQPSFWTSAALDFNTFNSTFDFLVSRSVWTHMSKKQIEAYMKAFKSVSHDTSKILTSIFKNTEDCSHDYLGDDFLGLSEHSNENGMATHCMPWLRQTSVKYGLEIEGDPRLELNQWWVVLRHAHK